MLLALCLTTVCPDPNLSGGGGVIKIEDLQNNSYDELNSPSHTILENIPILSDETGEKPLTITYHSNNGANNTIDKSYDLTFVRLESPTALGLLSSDFNFLGWCDDPNGGPYIYSTGDIYSAYSKHIDFYAIWNPYVLTVTFETFGGTTISPVQLNYNYVLTLPDDPVRSNSTFMGWYLDKEFKNPFFINEPIIEDTTLYAKWYTYSIDYQVRYDDNDSTSGTAPRTSYFESGDIFKLPGPGNLVKDGFTFAGWSYSGIVYQQGDSFRMPSKSIHFVAEWEKIPDYTVLFLVDENQYSSAKVESGKLVEVPAAPTKDGYKFTHWSLEGTEYDFTSAVMSDLELVAEWEKLADPVIDTKNNGGSNQPNWFYTAIAIICIIVAILAYLLYKNKI